jgi:hypothetical protein
MDDIKQLREWTGEVETLAGNLKKLGNPEPYINQALQLARDWQAAYDRDVPTWQPIETAPKDGRCILACIQNDVIPPEVIQWMPETENEPGAWSDGRKCFRSCPFTHWMPLPEPPK